MIIPSGYDIDRTDNRLAGLHICFETALPFAMPLFRKTYSRHVSFGIPNGNSESNHIPGTSVEEKGIWLKSGIVGFGARTAGNRAEAA